jgi:molybdenum-dependent DNA-binding transcriptional regulator ModE
MHKKRLSISPAWVFRTDNGELFEPVLFRLLETIRDSGKLTAAAEAAGVSYRHACNQGSFTNEHFQYIDKKAGKWTREQKTVAVVAPAAEEPPPNDAN